MSHARQESETVHLWTMRIVQDIAPSEVDFAPMVVDAYMNGGNERANLFPGPGSIPGAFAAGEVLVLTPYLLKAIVVAGPFLLGALSSTTVRDLATSVRNILELTNASRTVRKALTEQQSAPPQLLTLLNSLSKELRSAGLSEDQADAIALRMLRSMLQNPESANGFVKALTARV